ncbi:hypothetical protein ACJIZ3_013929 [Penstemon smallii]|uniref:Reverse transcriptase zinc-binding domain-containing protein n=1 Tax=Penstemon smallii TaxID=265156 RepID=A0ABD3RLH5_9LAMI
MKLSTIETRQGGPSQRQVRNWDWIWKIYAPPKVKHFIWSCLSNALPVRSQLQHRKLLDEAFCLRCGNGDETIVHCLSTCSYARQIWALSNLPYSSYSNSSFDSESWFNQVRSRLDNSDFGFFASLCWWIWYSRNKFMWEANDIQPLILVNSVREFHGRFVSSKSILKPPAPDRSSTSWSPPSLGFTKLNFDAAVLNNGAGIGIGIVARNSVGDSEATAALQAVQFGLEFGWSQVIIEGDCSNVIKGIMNRETSFCYLGALHTVRENNRVAHLLAKLAFVDFDFAFSCDLPSEVFEIVLSEYL